MNFFVVYFDETTLNKVFLLFLTAGESDDLIESSRNNSLGFLRVINSHHCVSFPAASLAVREDGAIVTLKDTINKRKCSLLIDLTLQGVHPEDMIECEWFRIFFVFGPIQVNLILFAVNIHNVGAV